DRALDRPLGRRAPGHRAPGHPGLGHRALTGWVPAPGTRLAVCLRSLTRTERLHRDGEHQMGSFPTHARSIRVIEPAPADLPQGIGPTLGRGPSVLTGVGLLLGSNLRVDHG